MCYGTAYEIQGLSWKKTAAAAATKHTPCEYQINTKEETWNSVLAILTAGKIVKDLKVFPWR